MVKYIVRVDILKFDEENGFQDIGNFEDVFKDSNPIAARNNAIERMKSLEIFLFDEISETITFSTTEEAIIKRNNGEEFNICCMKLFVQTEDWPLQISGCLEESLEGLQDEALHYYGISHSETLIEIVDDDGYVVEIIESNHEYLLNF